MISEYPKPHCELHSEGTVLACARCSTARLALKLWLAAVDQSKSDLRGCSQPQPQVSDAINQWQHEPPRSTIGDIVKRVVELLLVGLDERRSVTVQLEGVTVVVEIDRHVIDGSDDAEAVTR